MKFCIPQLLASTFFICDDTEPIVTDSKPAYGVGHNVNSPAHFLFKKLINVHSPVLLAGVAALQMGKASGTPTSILKKSSSSTGQCWPRGTEITTGSLVLI